MERKTDKESTDHKSLVHVLYKIFIGPNNLLFLFLNTAKFFVESHGTIEFDFLFFFVLIIRMCKLGSTNSLQLYKKKVLPSKINLIFQILKLMIIYRFHLIFYHCAVSRGGHLVSGIEYPSRSDRILPNRVGYFF